MSTDASSDTFEFTQTSTSALSSFDTQSFLTSATASNGVPIPVLSSTGTPSSADTSLRIFSTTSSPIPPHSSESSEVVPVASTTSVSPPAVTTKIPATFDSSVLLTTTVPATFYSSGVATTTLAATFRSPPILPEVVTTAEAITHFVVTTNSAGVVITTAVVATTSRVITRTGSSSSLSLHLQSESSSAPVPASTTPNDPPASTTPNDTPASRRNRPFVPGAIVGSLVGTLLLGVCVFLYIRHRYRRTNCIVTPIQHFLLYEKEALRALNDSEPAPQSSTPKSPQFEEETSALAEPVNHQETHRDGSGILGDSDQDVRVEVAEIRMTMGRMMDHVHWMENRIVGSSQTQRRDTESIASSDGPPPAYGS
ncbi:hypothetical protein D9757_012978 [Collybiopsis confluens]|uniref:Uncharacterized protein n=1 Tax=Collybiopsis confluens TaxID=2823264 RepID=A0A8H5LPS4_9AGAR|nr:hypothetical protein D9757_012978 [Collybiopsis confluens]